MCLSSCVRLLKRKPDHITVTVRIHSWNAVLETTKHKWDESFVRGIRGFEHVFKAAVTDSISKTNSVTGCRWRKQETQEDLEEAHMTSFYDLIEKKIMQDQRTMKKLADKCDMYICAMKGALKATKKG